MIRTSRSCGPGSSILLCQWLGCHRVTMRRHRLKPFEVSIGSSNVYIELIQSIANVILRHSFTGNCLTSHQVEDVVVPVGLSCRPQNVARPGAPLKLNSRSLLIAAGNTTENQEVQS